MKSKRIANLLFILIFLGFLFVGAAATVLRPKAAVSFYENRALAAVPAFSRTSPCERELVFRLGDLSQGSRRGPGISSEAQHVSRPVRCPPSPSSTTSSIAGRELLSFNGYPQVDSAAIAKQSAKMTDSLKSLDTLVRQNGGTFLYVAVPMQSDYLSASYPSYLQSRADYSNIVRTQFKADMAARGVSVVDMGDVFDAAGRSGRVLFRHRPPLHVRRRI